MASEMRICVQNLGKYNEGELWFEWLDMPAEQEDIDAALEKIGINEEYEEYEVADVEGLPYSQYRSVSKYNEIAEAIQSLVDDHKMPFDVAYQIIEEEGYEDIEDKIDGMHTITRIYDTDSDEETVGFYFAEMDGTVAYLEERDLISYFDFEHYGRELLYEYEIYSGDKNVYLLSK